MGYGLPASVGVQLAHPKSLVIDIAGEASVQMTIQELSTAVQYRLPIKIFIINNGYMGMVRQWQELLQAGVLRRPTPRRCRIVELADAMHAVTVSVREAGRSRPCHQGDDRRRRPVLFDCVSDPKRTASR